LVENGDNIQTFDLQFNNLRRNYNNEIDTSMDKNFKFAERKYIQIRFEAFNLQNRVTLGAPNTTRPVRRLGKSAARPIRLDGWNRHPPRLVCSDSGIVK
jgi:hypothetical protein